MIEEAHASEGDHFVSLMFDNGEVIIDKWLVARFDISPLTTKSQLRGRKLQYGHLVKLPLNDALRNLEEANQRFNGRLVIDLMDGGTLRFRGLLSFSTESQPSLSVISVVPLE